MMLNYTSASLEDSTEVDVNSFGRICIIIYIVYTYIIIILKLHNVFGITSMCVYM